MGGAGGAPLPECMPLEPLPDGAACAVTPGGGARLFRGRVLTPEGALDGGEVLIDAAGAIACVDCSCAEHPAAAGATVVTCPDGAVSPGLINAHDHLTYTFNAPGDWGDERYEHRNDWRLGARGHTEIEYEGRASDEQMIWGELRQVLGGTTSLSGAGSVEGFLRNLDRGADLEGLLDESVRLDVFPLGSSGFRTRDCSYSELPDEGVLGANAWSPHVAEGIDPEARNEFLCLSSEDRGGVDVTESNGAFIHGIPLRAIDGAELAANGTAVVWSPRTNIALYGHTAPVTMLAAQGVRIALGTDWTLSGSVNLLRELQCASELNALYGGYFSNQDLWAMATYQSAAAMGVDAATGSLRPGLAGDLAIFDGRGVDDPYGAVVGAHPGDVMLVLRGRDVLYGDASVVETLSPGCEQMGDVCGVSKRVCAQRETGRTFDALQAANAASYGLFFCDPPPDEPTCVPWRQGDFDGVPTAGDADGDGVPDANDNCPSVFNPVRPVDGDAQADHDADGDGDACDPCPIDPRTEDCRPPDPNDGDGDGVPDHRDVCPGLFDPDQADSDGDGHGDGCDACPEDPNPGTAPCPATIYGVKQGQFGIGQRVQLSGVVTALPPGEGGRSFFLQVPTADQDAMLGADFSGVFAFVPNGNPSGVPALEPGALISLQAQVQDFFGQTQLSFVDAVEVLAPDEGVPTPAPGTPAELTGARAEALEAVLVVTEGEVTALNPAPGPGGVEEPSFVIDGTLEVRSFLHGIDPLPFVGDRVRVTGVLRLANQKSKLEPRSAADVEVLGAVPPSLARLSPAQAFAPVAPQAGPTAPPLTVHLDRRAGEGGVMVTLASGDPAALTVPAMVVVPAGADSVDVPVRGLQAGAAPITVTAELDGVERTADVVVYDPAAARRVVGLGPADLTVLSGQTAEVMITLDAPAGPGGAEVALSSDPAGALDHAATIEVPEGSRAAIVQVEAVALQGEVALTATLGGDVDLTVTIVDRPPLGLVLSEVLYDTAGDDNGKEWVEIFNGTGVEIDLAGYSLGSGGGDWAVTRLQLAGTIPPGGCFVVGGPMSAADNASPAFDQAVDLQPDLQNSGDDADGVALFDVPAAMVRADTVPMDVVLYGEMNGNGLIGPDGMPAPVDAGDAPAGQSVERTADGWAVQAMPTPGICHL